MFNIACMQANIVCREIGCCGNDNLHVWTVQTCERYHLGIDILYECLQILHNRLFLEEEKILKLCHKLIPYMVQAKDMYEWQADRMLKILEQNVADELAVVTRH